MRRRAMAVTCFAVTALAAGPAPGLQMAIEPRVVQLDKVTCGEVFALTNEQRNRLLLYLDGYVGGMRRITTWDERVQGELIERALAHCKTSPGDSVLATFIKFAP